MLCNVYIKLVPRLFLLDPCEENFQGSPLQLFYQFQLPSGRLAPVGSLHSPGDGEFWQHHFPGRVRCLQAVSCQPGRRWQPSWGLSLEPVVPPVEEWGVLSGSENLNLLRCRYSRKACIIRCLSHFVLYASFQQDAVAAARSAKPDRLRTHSTRSQRYVKSSCSASGHAWLQPAQTQVDWGLSSCSSVLLSLWVLIESSMLEESWVHTWTNKKNKKTLLLSCSHTRPQNKGEGKVNQKPSTSWCNVVSNM